MVSVVFAIWPFPQRLNASRSDRTGRAARPPADAHAHARAFMQQATCQFSGGLRLRFGFDIAWQHGQGRNWNDVNDVPSLPEPHGPDGAMADGGRGRAEISQSRAAGRLRQSVRAAGGGARTDLALLADLHPPGLWHRQRDGRQPGSWRSPKRSSTRRRSARCCASRRRNRRSSRACCWWRRCPAISRRCCAAP